MSGGSSTVFAGEVSAGVAKEEFRLPARVPLAGYSKRHGRPSTGAHDPVGVRALVLRGDGTTVALVSCDVLIIDERLFEAVRRRLPSEGPLANAVLMIAATHTHSGPGAYGRQFLEKVSMGHFNPSVFETLVASIARAIERADAARQPVELTCASRATEGLVKNRVTAGGFADNELSACAFYPTGNRAPLAVVVDFAAHPTALGAWNTALSADYPGVVEREIERRFPSTTALFFAGSVGDQAPVKSGDRFERAERIGIPLAEQASRFVERAAASEAAPLGAIQERLPLPPSRVRFCKHAALPRWISRRLVDDDATLTVVRAGKSVWFGVPCDLSAALGQQLKEAARARGLFPVVVGFADDYIGYCVAESVYQTAKYEALMAFNGPQAGELIVSRLIELLDRLAVSTEHTAHRSQP